MPQKIHYRDDLYLLSVLVKTLEAGFAVDADPEYFRDRLVGDVFFIDATIRSFHALLTQNSHLLDRAEYLKLLERSARDFSRILGGVLAGSGPSAEAYAPYHSQFQVLQEGLAVLAEELRALYSTAAEGRDTETELVSQDELSQLLGA